MNFKFLTFLSLISGATLFAQTSSIEYTQILNEESPYQVTKVDVMGMTKDAVPTDLYYSFTHPGGGVQKVNGSLFSGGKEPTNLEAFGFVQIGEEGTAAPSPVRWVAQNNARTNVNFYANPLSNAAALNQQPLAGPGQVSSHDTLREVSRGLIKPTGLLPMSLPAKELVGPEFMEEYYYTHVYVGMSGGLSQVATVTQRLRPAEDRDRTLALGGDYKAENTNNKDGVEGAFAADNISYKHTAGGTIPQVHDPVSGNVMVIGGIKYKKDKTKEYSQFREFRMFTFNKEGELVKKVNYDSDEPLNIKGAYPIYGEYMATKADVRTVTHAVIVAQGGGHRKMENINNKHFRVLVVDMLTGEIVAENQTDFSQGDAKLFKQHLTANGEMEFLYTYPDAANKGLVLVRVDKDGLFEVKEFASDSPEAQSLGNWSFTPLFRAPHYEVTMDNGEELQIVEMYRKVSSTAGQSPTEVGVGFVAFRYNAQGQLLTLQRLSEDFNLGNYELFAKSEQQLVFNEQYKVAESNKNKIRFATLNTETLELTIVELEEEYFLTNTLDFFFDEERNIVSFFTQQVAGKGLYFAQYKF